MSCNNCTAGALKFPSPWHSMARADAQVDAAVEAMAHLLSRLHGLAAVVDWDDASRGDPLADVACARGEICCAYGWPAADRFTDAYVAHVRSAGNAVDLFDLPCRWTPPDLLSRHTCHMIDWTRGETIVSARLRLEPLSMEHAAKMVKVLADTSLYEYTGGEAPSLEELQRRYARQAAGHSDDGLQAWFNWIVVPRDADAPIGFVQATVEPSGPDFAATLAWVISSSQQGQGLASEATQAMIIWLRSGGVHSFVAQVHPEHFASMGVARKQGLHATGVMKDGEVRWES